MSLSPAEKRSAIAAAFLVLASLATIPFDQSFAASYMHWLGDSVRPVRNFVSLGNMFVEDAGLVLIGALILLLDSRRHEVFPRVVLGQFLAGMTGQVLKAFFNRARPAIDRDADYALEVSADQLGRWFAGLRGNPDALFDSDFISYPSGHAIVATYLAMGLSHYYPRGRPVWFALAVLCMTYRVVNTRHFISDCLAGAAVGILVWLILQRLTFHERLWRWVVSKATRRPVPV